MGKRWLKRKKGEYYYRRAKRERYRSRASYKLKQLNRKFGVVRRGYKVIELGAAPGGWTQVALEVVGKSGRVVAVDLEEIEPMEAENAVFLRGDFTSKETAARIKENLDSCDAVISDASPEISGAWDIDHFRSVELCEKALEIAEKFLRPGGNFLCKVFQGEGMEGLRDKVKRKFGFMKLSKPKASRKGSAEIYIVAKGFKGEL